MQHTQTWAVSVFLEEVEGDTFARARLTNADRELTGEGVARCRPGDRDIPEIGDELATARALADLAHQLIESAVADLDAIGQGGPPLSA
jgi:hypothetical protein